MKAKIIKTEGYALAKLLEIDGSIYHAMDDISPPGSKIEEGIYVDIQFHVYTFEELE